MQITVSGHHIEVTDSLRQHAVSKLQKIGSHFPEVTSIDVTLTLDNAKNQVAEIRTVYHGKETAVRVESADMYAAITQGREKLHRILSGRKGAEKTARKDKSVAPQPVESADIIEAANLAV